MPLAFFSQIQTNSTMEIPKLAKSHENWRMSEGERDEVMYHYRSQNHRIVGFGRDF